MSMCICLHSLVLISCVDTDWLISINVAQPLTGNRIHLYLIKVAKSIKMVFTQSKSVEVTWIKTLLHQGLSELEFYGDLVYKFKKL